jgi:hypothetical protein
LRHGLVRALGGAVVLGLVAVLLTGVGYRWQLRARSDAYDRLIREASLRHGIAPGLVKAIIWRESRFRPYTVGRAQEVGLMQITAGAVSDWHDWSGGIMPSRSMCFDPGLNIEIGTWYMARHAGVAGVPQRRPAGAGGIQCRDPSRPALGARGSAAGT